jgi:hypothetical protein
MRSEHILINSVKIGNYPITFHLKKMILAETNYDIHDKKLLAIMTAL